MRNEKAVILMGRAMWKMHSRNLTHLGFVALLVNLAACGGDEAEMPSHVSPVDVTVVRPVTTSGFITAPGNVLASQEVQLATRISGTIRRMEVDVGARVAAGDTLVVLDTEEINARIRSAEAAAHLARRSHERIAALARDGAATAQELDDAEARLEMAEAALQDARAQSKYVVLDAPVPGVITARMADPGDLAHPGVPLLVLMGSGALKIESDLPGELVGGIAPGDRVFVIVPDSETRLAARITRVVPALDPASHRFRVEIGLEDAASGRAATRPGTFVRLELENPATTTRWIPRDALVRQGQLIGVFVVRDDHLRLRWVRLGDTKGDAVELLAGPGPEALIVRRPPDGLRDGHPVGSVQRSEWNPSDAAAPATTRERIG